MPRLKFLIQRARRMDWHKMWQTAEMLHKKTGKSRVWLLNDMLHCAVKYGAGYMDYKIAEMYRLTPAQRETVITRAMSKPPCRPPITAMTMMKKVTLASCGQVMFQKRCHGLAPSMSAAS